MINTSAFYNALISRGIDFFTGVPDSLLKDICAFISDNAPEDRHIIAANEGASVGLAVGSEGAAYAVVVLLKLAESLEYNAILKVLPVVAVKLWTPFNSSTLKLVHTADVIAIIKLLKVLLMVLLF